MKIAWFCIPAHGHTNPTLGLVKALTEAGHEICYFSFEMFREKIENAGAVFIPCDGYDSVFLQLQVRPAFCGFLLRLAAEDYIICEGPLKHPGHCVFIEGGKDE